MKITVLVKKSDNLLADLSYVLAKAKVHVDDISYEIFGDNGFITIELENIKKNIERTIKILMNSGFTIVDRTNGLVSSF